MFSQEHYLALCAKSDRVVSADAVAAAIHEGVRKRRRTIYIPQIEALFSLLGNIAPGLRTLHLAPQSDADSKPQHLLAVTPLDPSEKAS
jgi:hypothetical protein